MTKEESLKLIEEREEFWVVVAETRPWSQGDAPGVILAKERFSNIGKYTELLDYCAAHPRSVIIDSGNRIFLHPEISGCFVNFNPENFPDRNIYVDDIEITENSIEKIFFENGMNPKWNNAYCSYGFPFHGQSASENE